MLPLVDYLYRLTNSSYRLSILLYLDLNLLALLDLCRLDVAVFIEFILVQVLVLLLSILAPSSIGFYFVTYTAIYLVEAAKRFIICLPYTIEFIILSIAYACRWFILCLAHFVTFLPYTMPRFIHSAGL